MTRAMEISDGRQGQPVPALPAALAGDQPGVLQVAEDRLEEARRDVLGGGDLVAGQRAGRRGGQLEGGTDGVVDPGGDAHRPILPPRGGVCQGDAVPQLRFTTRGGGAADRRLRRRARPRPAVGRAAGGGRVRAAVPRRVRRGPAPRTAVRLTHSRRFSATGAGTLVDEQVDWATALPGPAGRGGWTGWCCAVAWRGRCRRTWTPTPRRPRGGRGTSCRWSASPWSTATACWWPSAPTGRSPACWEFPGGKVEPGEADLDGAGPRVPGGAGRRRARRRRSSGRCRWTASSAAAPRVRPRCGSGGGGSPPAW